MSTTTFEWERDGRARLVKLDGENVTVRSSKPGAPGSRPVGVLASGSQVRMKVHRCRKCDEGDGLVFTLEGRLLDATRVLRAELGLLLEAPESAESTANEPDRPAPSE
jgi:hypothetical protein